MTAVRGTDVYLSVQVQVRAAEVAATRRRFELSRFDLVHHLNQLETKKKFQLVSC
jgi:hypothetical protein